MLSIILKASKLSSLTRTLMGVVKALRVIARGLGRDRKENEELKRMSSMVEGSVCTLEQCMGAPSRKVTIKPDRIEKFGQMANRTNSASRQEKVKADLSRRPMVEQPKRKMVSPVEGKTSSRR